MMVASSQSPSEEELRYAALRAATKDGTEAYQPSGFVMGQIVDVYDGDTCRLAITAPKLGIGAAEGETAVQYLRIRTLGYDAPEMKLAHRPYGLEVKAVLEGLVLNRIVVAYIPIPKEDASHGYAVPDKSDPYGRTLAHLFVAPLGGRLSPPRARRPPPPYTGRGLSVPLPPAPPAAGGVAPTRAAALCGRCFSCLWPGRPPPAETREPPPVGTRALSPLPLLARAEVAGGADKVTMERGAESRGAWVRGSRAAPLSTPPHQVVVRGAPVPLPGTEDVPCGYGGSFEETAKLIWVNGWMVDHARVKPYDGRAAREGYTDEELAEGYPAPLRPETGAPRAPRGEAEDCPVPLRPKTGAPRAPRGGAEGCPVPLRPETGASWAPRGEAGEGPLPPPPLAETE